MKKAELNLLAKQAQDLPIGELVEQLTVLSIEAEAWSDQGNVARFDEISERAAIPLREIERRSAFGVLGPLMRSDSLLIALTSAVALARDEPTGKFRDEALAVLDRIADMCIGPMSFDAMAVANSVRYGDSFPSEEQKRQATKDTMAKSDRSPSPPATFPVRAPDGGTIDVPEMPGLGEAHQMTKSDHAAPETSHAETSVHANESHPLVTRRPLHRHGLAASAMPQRQRSMGLSATI